MSNINLNLCSITGQCKDKFNLLRQSTFVKNAAWLLLLNLLSRGVGFFAAAYAMRCLGPVNVGISALILTTVQQVSLSFNPGFDTIAIRKIAASHESVNSITQIVITSRLVLAVITSLFWVLAYYVLIPKQQSPIWLIGVPIMLAGAGSIAFVFSGLEKLPIQNAIGTGGVLLTAIFYYTFFHPNMFLGADLMVASIVGLTTMVISWLLYHRMLGFFPVGTVSIKQALLLVHESWRYWLLAVFVFFYSAFQFPLIAYLLGTHELGIFRAAFGLAAGVELLFNSINSLLVPRLVNWKKMGLDFMWHRQAKLLFLFLMIGLPVVVSLILLAPTIYSLFLGEAFKEGVLVFQILVVGRLVVFLGQIYAYGLVATGLDNAFLGASIFGAATSITLNFLLIPKFGLLGAACVSVASEIIIHTYCYLVTRRKIKSA